MSSEFSITAGELARRLGGTLNGDAALPLRDIAALHEARPQSLSWAQNDRHLARAVESEAGAILTPTGADAPAEKTCIAVADVEVAVRLALEVFSPPAIAVPLGVHPTAVVADSAIVEGAAIGPHAVMGEHSRVGPGTQLHAGVYVGPHSVVGNDCVLWPNVVVRERVTIGNRVIIHPNTTIGSDGFGYIFRDGRHLKVPQIGTVEIADDVEIGANCAVDRAKCGVTRIGRGAKIDNLVQVAHNVRIDEGCIVVAQCGIGGSATLGRNVVLAGQAGLADHIRLGDGAQVTAQSGVSHDIPAGAVVRGSPAVPIRDYHRQQAAVRKLPEWAERLRELRKRIEKLELSADDRE